MTCKHTDSKTDNVYVATEIGKLYIAYKCSNVCISSGKS